MSVNPSNDSLPVIRPVGEPGEHGAPDAGSAMPSELCGSSFGEMLLDVVTDGDPSIGADFSSVIRSAIVACADKLGCKQIVPDLVGDFLVRGKIDDCTELFGNVQRLFPEALHGPLGHLLQLGRLLCLIHEEEQQSDEPAANCAPGIAAGASLERTLDFLCRHSVFYSDVAAKFIIDCPNIDQHKLIRQLIRIDKLCRISEELLAKNLPGLGILNGHNAKELVEFLSSPGAQILMFGGDIGVFGYYLYHLGGQCAPEDRDIIPPSLKKLGLNPATTAVAFHAAIDPVVRDRVLSAELFGGETAPRGDLYRILTCLALIEAFQRGATHMVGYVRISPSANTAIEAHHASGWIDAVYEGKPLTVTIPGRKIAAAEIAAAKDADERERLRRKSHYEDQVLQIMTLDIAETLKRDDYRSITAMLKESGYTFPFLNFDLAT